MKKLLLLAALLATSASVFAQSVVFQNTASTNYRIWTNNATGTASNLMSGLNGYRISLYAAQGAGQPVGSLQIVGLATNSPLPGFFSGGASYNLPAPFAAGDTITFQIRAWSIPLTGTDYASAVAAQNANPLLVQLGVSPLGQTQLGGGPVLPGPLWGTSPGQLQSGFELKPAPEPSSIALGLLGLGAIALFRRRK
jgi:MYXO-CTERM domain-containing protein